MSAEIWIVDDDRAIRWVLEKALTQANFEVKSFTTGEEVLAQLAQSLPAAIITDIRMPGIDGFELLREVRDSYAAVPVIIITAYADLDRAVAAFQGGAFEYLPKPFDVDEAVSIVQRAVAKTADTSEAANDDAEMTKQTNEIIGQAPAMQEVFRAIGRLSKSHMTVLLTGESGTGKELIARALHRHSPRSANPFVAINTAAIPRDLLESELFGHERGAFTGATSQRSGRFEQAAGGTLFLDEIGDMPADLQTRLLRVLSEGSFYRVGGLETVNVDVRVIAATHQNLEQRVAEGTFREDLFHRLNVIQLHLPALRERDEDIPELAEHFLQTTAAELDITAKRLRPAAQDALRRFAWPGNVRQLENICRRISVMASSQWIECEDLPAEILAHRELGTGSVGTQAWEERLRQWAQATVVGHAGPPLLEQALPRFERTMINVALNHTGGRRQEAAQLLGWGRNTLTRKIKDLGLDE